MSMAPLLTISGYGGPDPLDRAPGGMRYLLTMLVSALLGTAFLYVCNIVIGAYTFQQPWMFWAGAAVFTFVWGPLLTLMRRSSSLLVMAMIFVPTVLLDIYLQAHYRDHGLTALWMYNPGTFMSGLDPIVRFVVAWSFDAVIMGPIALWLARLLAGAIYPASRVAAEPTEEQKEEMFSKDWTVETVDPPDDDLAHTGLLILGLSYAAYIGFLLVGLVGITPFPAAAQVMLKMSYENPALLINTFSKILIMTVLALTGAYNRNLRWHCALGLLFGHGLSTVASLFFYFYDPVGTPYRDFLLTSAIVDGVMVLFFTYVMISYRSSENMFARPKEFPEFYSLAGRLSRIFYYVFAALCATFFLSVLYYRFFSDPGRGLGAIYGFPDPQVGNTLTKYGTLALMAFLMARREGLREKLVRLILVPYSVNLVCSALWLLFGDMTGGLAINTRSVDLGSGARIAASVDWYFMLNVFVDIIFLGSLLGLRKMYYDVEYSIIALSPSSAQNVMAMHEALYGGTADEQSMILHAIDRHVAGIRGRKRGLLNFPFWIVENILAPIYGLRPGFSTMDAGYQRHFLRRYMLRPPDERRRAIIPGLAEAVYKIGTAVHALITLAHYTNLKTKGTIGYIPPEARDRLQGDIPTVRPPYVMAAALPDGPNHPANNKPWPEIPIPSPPPHPLVAPRVVTPIAEATIPDEVDYLIIGSGAGGAVMAYRLACEVQDPSRILMIERGPRYSPLQDFNDDEMEMVRKLYKEGGLQQTKRFDLMILQGECVGGTTVINNSVCFPMPPHIRERWEGEFDIRLAELDDAYGQVADELDIGVISEVGINQNVEKVFRRGIDGYNAGLTNGEVLTTERLKANHRNMAGDGLCNIGNKRQRKRSMLETYIPWAEARGVRIVGETSAVRFVGNGRRAESVMLRTDMGTLKSVRVKKAVIVAGGVIASSHLLMRSEVAGPVGKGMACNFAFPVAFEFPEKLDAFDGVQITIGALDAKCRAIFETYFNPPGAFSISLPFYFDRLTDTMASYCHMINFGALVGSETNGEVERTPDVINGRAFTWSLGDRDREAIRYTLGTLVDIGHAAGATRSLIPTEPGIDLPLTEGNIRRFKRALADYPLRMEDLRLTTAHPQGGNRMIGSASKVRAERVVDENFRVEGFDNVYVADASVFPSGITVNPQWTIMALSTMAAKRVLEG